MYSQLSQTPILFGLIANKFVYALIAELLSTAQAADKPNFSSNL